jgi:hypothetical protein
VAPHGHGHSHGKSQKEAPPEDEQAQAPEALEVQSPQEAYVAEIVWRSSRRAPAIEPAGFRRVFLRLVFTHPERRGIKGK